MASQTASHCPSLSPRAQQDQGALPGVPRAHCAGRGFAGAGVGVGCGRWRDERAGEFPCAFRPVSGSRRTLCATQSESATHGAMNEIMEAVTELNKMRGERACPTLHRPAHPRPLTHSITRPAVSESVSAAFSPILTLLVTTSKPPLCVRGAAGTSCARACAEPHRRASRAPHSSVAIRRRASCLLADCLSTCAHAAAC